MNMHVLMLQMLITSYMFMNAGLSYSHKLPNSFTTSTQSLHWASGWGHVTVFMLCKEGSRMHWMLSTVNHTPLSPRSFIQEDLFCILARDLCNSPARCTVMTEQGICVYILHCFIMHQVIFLCCVIVHMYLCTECVYWYETHSYCYLCIAKFL